MYSLIGLFLRMIFLVVSAQAVVLELLVGFFFVFK